MVGAGGRRRIAVWRPATDEEVEERSPSGRTDTVAHAKRGAVLALHSTIPPRTVRRIRDPRQLRRGASAYRRCARITGGARPGAGGHPHSTMVGGDQSSRRTRCRPVVRHCRVARWSSPRHRRELSARGSGEQLCKQSDGLPGVASRQASRGSASLTQRVGGLSDEALAGESLSAQVTAHDRVT